MSEEVFVAIFAMSVPVMLAAIICAYKLINRWIAANGAAEIPKPPKVFAKESVDELRARAAEMQRRLATLEEIIASESKPREISHESQ